MSEQNEAVVPVSTKVTVGGNVYDLKHISAADADALYTAMCGIGQTPSGTDYKVMIAEMEKFIAMYQSIVSLELPPGMSAEQAYQDLVTALQNGGGKLLDSASETSKKLLDTPAGKWVQNNALWKAAKGTADVTNDVGELVSATGEVIKGGKKLITAPFHLIRMAEEAAKEGYNFIDGKVNPISGTKARDLATAYAASVYAQFDAPDAPDATKHKDISQAGAWDKISARAGVIGGGIWEKVAPLLEKAWKFITSGLKDWGKISAEVDAEWAAKGPSKTYEERLEEKMNGDGIKTARAAASDVMIAAEEVNGTSTKKIAGLVKGGGIYRTNDGEVKTLTFDGKGMPQTNDLTVKDTKGNPVKVNVLTKLQYEANAIAPENGMQATGMVLTAALGAKPATQAANYIASNASIGYESTRANQFDSQAKKLGNNATKAGNESLKLRGQGKLVEAEAKLVEANALRAEATAAEQAAARHAAAAGRAYVTPAQAAAEAMETSTAAKFSNAAKGMWTGLKTVVNPTNWPGLVSQKVGGVSATVAKPLRSIANYFQTGATNISNPFHEGLATAPAANTTATAGQAAGTTAEAATAAETAGTKLSVMGHLGKATGWCGDKLSSAWQWCGGKLGIGGTVAAETTAEAAAVASTGSKVLGTLGKFGGRVVPVAGPVLAAGSDLVDTYQAGKEGNVKQSVRSASRAVGGAAGSWVGAEGGALAGAAIGVWFGGAGAVPGAIIGGIAGGIGGFFTGRWSVGQIADASTTNLSEGKSTITPVKSPEMDPGLAAALNDPKVIATVAASKKDPAMAARLHSADDQTRIKAMQEIATRCGYELTFSGTKMVVKNVKVGAVHDLVTPSTTPPQPYVTGQNRPVLNLGS